MTVEVGTTGTGTTGAFSSSAVRAPAAVVAMAGGSVDGLESALALGGDGVLIEL